MRAGARPLERRAARSDDPGVVTKARAALILAVGVAALALAGRAEAQQAGALGAPSVETPPAVEAPPAEAAPVEAAPVEAAPAEEAPGETSAPTTTEGDDPGGDLLPEPAEAPERTASRALDAPVAPPMAPRDAAQMLANIELEELALAREEDGIDGDRTLSIALYVGGIGLTIGAVAMLVAAVLQGVCVSEEFGCYDAPQLIIGGVPVALVGALILSGASLTSARVGIRERALRPRRDSLDEQRRRLERRVGLAVGPGSLRVSVAF